MTTLLRDLAECADEIGACGAGNEAAVVRKAMAEITSLRAQLDEARRKAIQLPKWNDLTAAQRNAIADGILLPHPEERMQTAIEAYAAVRRALLSEGKS